MKDLPYNNVRRIMKNVVRAKDMLVSRNAVELMRELAEEYIERRTLKAMLIAKNGRKRTIMRRDLELTI